MEMLVYFWNLHTASFHWRVIHRSRSWNRSGFGKGKKPRWLWRDLRSGARWTRPGRGRCQPWQRPPGWPQPSQQRGRSHLNALIATLSNVILEVPWVQKYDNALSAKTRLRRFILFPLNSTVSIEEALVLLLLVPSIINTLQDLGWFIIILNSKIFAAFNKSMK